MHRRGFLGLIGLGAAAAAAPAALGKTLVSADAAANLTAAAIVNQGAWATGSFLVPVDYSSEIMALVAARSNRLPLD
jgi:hypothetical protein